MGGRFWVLGELSESGDEDESPPSPQTPSASRPVVVASARGDGAPGGPQGPSRHCSFAPGGRTASFNGPVLPYLGGNMFALVDVAF